MIGSDDSDFSDDDSPKKRRDLLTRRPSYRKILNDLGGGEIGKCNNLLHFWYIFLLIKSLEISRKKTIIT